MQKSIISTVVLSSTLILSLNACGQKAEVKSVQQHNEQTKVAQQPMGVNVSAMDRSVKPGDDFYNYANGTWMKTTEIPADRSGTGAGLIAFKETEKNNGELIANLLSSDQPVGSDNAKIAAFYKAYMDTDAINKTGMKPVQDRLAEYAAISNRAELSKVLGENLRADVDPLNATDFRTENLFGIFVTQGLATPGIVLPYILQGGLGLPEREYYLSDDDKMSNIRTAYHLYIKELLNKSGVADAAKKADRIFALETKIAKAHATRADSEDFSKSSGVWSRSDFDNNAPGIDWDAFLKAANLAKQTNFAAYHAKAITALSALVASESIEDWKDWLVFHQINSHTHVLPSQLDQAHFNFYGSTLYGTPQQRTRDKRALSALNIYLGDAVGRAYTKKYFPESSKTQIQLMVKNIVNAFADRVKAIDWMAETTKTEALAKVESIVVGVGYPNTWRDYSQFSISATTPYANVIAGEKTEYAHQLAKLGQPMDKGEWWMNAQIVNAVNLPVQNALNFPAGILQPPFFVANSDPAFNYGAIGAVIGHEISHSFDNNGAAFDSTGAMRNWWTKEDFARFAKQGDALAEQYDAYTPFEGLHVNGKLTLGENIADVAGLAAAYDAYHYSLNNKPSPVIGGFTGEQRFFIGFAQTWATKMREKAMRARIATDGHAPGQYRALTIRNIDDWYTAFDVKPGDKLYLAPEKRVKIW